MLTSRQAAEYLGISLDHLRRLLRSGNIASVDVGSRGGRRTYRIKQVDLDAWIAERKVVGRVNDERVRSWRANAARTAKSTN